MVSKWLWLGVIFFLCFYVVWDIGKWRNGEMGNERWRGVFCGGAMDPCGFAF
jgi:hypothetical protein